MFVKVGNLNFTDSQDKEMKINRMRRKHCKKRKNDTIKFKFKHIICMLLIFENIVQNGKETYQKHAPQS